MYDFDAERAKRHAEREQELGERTFKVGGETFYVRSNVGYQAIKNVAALTEEATGAETFEVIEQAVLSMIDPRDDAYKRFQAITDPTLDNPITFDDLVELQNWLMREQSGRPPTQPQSSASTPSPTGESLTDDSSTEPEGASTT